jgi:hypothetical protein
MISTGKDPEDMESVWPPPAKALIALPRTNYLPWRYHYCLGRRATPGKSLRSPHSREYEPVFYV